MAIGQQSPVVAQDLGSKLANFFRREELFAAHANFRDAFENLILFLTSLSEQEVSILKADHDIYIKINSGTPFADIQWYRKSDGVVVVAVYQNMDEDENSSTRKSISGDESLSLFTRDTTIPLAFLLKLVELSRGSSGPKLGRASPAGPAPNSAKPKNTKAVELPPSTAPSVDHLLHPASTVSNAKQENESAGTPAREPAPIRDKDRDHSPKTLTILEHTEGREKSQPCRGRALVTPPPTRSVRRHERPESYPQCPAAA